MKIKPRHFPYPVLSEFSDDYLESHFSAEINIEAEDDYKVSVSYDLNNQRLRELIKEKKALYSVHLECGRTMFRMIDTSDQEEHTFTVSEEKLHGNVEVCFFILAAENISQYSNDKFHPDFEGEFFSLNKGDILAIGPQKIITIEKEPIQNLNSVFKVTKNNEPKASPFTVFMEADHIVINLSVENYERYTMLAKNDPELLPVLNSMTVIPALVTALEYLKTTQQGTFNSSEVDLESYSWYRSIVKRLSEIGISLEQLAREDYMVDIAQKMIGDPFTDALQVIEEYSVYQGGEGDE